MFDRREQFLDEWLVLRSQEGDREAFQRLIRRWQERLWRHAYRLCGRSDLAWDVVQESLLSITRGLPKLHDPERFRPWAYTIVTRRATDLLRRRGPDEAGEDEAPEPCAPEDEGSDDDPRIGPLRTALARLPGDVRSLLSLRFVEGFEVARIAEILGIPEGTVKSRLHHAKQRLKEQLERTE